MTTATPVGATRTRWIENDLDGCLAAARSNGTLVLAWWTAAWCPPCNELKSAVFNNAAFEERGEKLGLARIDGDAPGAQALADRLQAQSYPTPILLDAQGHERLRLPGGFKAEEFCALLDRALAHPFGIAELVRRVQADEVVTERDYDILAHHWWGIDPVHAAGRRRIALLLRLFHSCPPKLHASRLRLLVHALWAVSRHPDSHPEIYSQAWGECARFLVEALSGPLPYSQLYPMLVAPEIVRNASPGDAAGQGRVEATLLEAAGQLLARGNLTHTERLISLSSVLVLRKRREDAPDVNRAMASRVKEAVREADRESVTFEQRQTAMNMAGHLLKGAGLVDEAQALFRAESERSPEGPYFMSYLADIAFERGDSEGGLEWLRRAWNETHAGAARFARGVRYVAKAAQLLEGREDFVSGEAIRLLAEQASARDAFEGLNRKNFRILLESLPALAGRFRPG